MLSTPARGLRWTHDGLLAVAGKGEVSLLDPASLDVRKTLPAPVGGQLVYLETLADGTIIAPSLSDNGVVWYGPGAARFIATGKGALNARLGPDGFVYVTNVDDDHLTKLDRKGNVVGSIGSKLKGPNAIGFGNCPVGNLAPANGPERG